MKEETGTDALWRDFLLGKVDDEERQRIESLFLTDAQLRQGVLAAEQDLIEDYLEDNLTIADSESFLSRYAQTDEQRRKLRITKSIKDWAVKKTEVVPPAVSSWSRLRGRLRLKPVFVVPIAVTAMMTIVFAIVWLNSRVEQQERLAIEQELARLNAPSSLREVPSQMVSLELAPVTLRDIQRQSELVRTADVRVVELRLLWMQKEPYPTYQAVLRHDKSFTVRNVQAATNGGRVIRLRIPADILTRGLYKIELSGIAADGTLGPPEEFTFAVRE